MDPDLKEAILTELTPDQFNNAVICHDSSGKYVNICYNNIQNGIFIRLQVIYDESNNFKLLKKINKQERMQQFALKKYIGPTKEIFHKKKEKQKKPKEKKIRDKIPVYSPDDSELKNIINTEVISSQQYYNNFIQNAKRCCHRNCRNYAQYARSDSLNGNEMYFS